jgi:hypothetical protein
MKKNLFLLKSKRSSKEKRKNLQLEKGKPIIIEPYITEKPLLSMNKQIKNR